MKKLILLFSISIAFLSCKKEKDITGQDVIVTVTSNLWSTSELRAVNLDSTRFQFYNKGSDNLPESSPFETLYTGPDGTCKVTLKGDTEYYVSCLSASYKSSGGSIHCYINPLTDEDMSSFHSTHEKNNKKNSYVPGDFTVTFISSQAKSGSGGTSVAINDPFNF